MQEYKRTKKKKRRITNILFIIFVIALIMVLTISLVRLYIRTDIAKIDEDLKVDRTMQTTTQKEEKDIGIEEMIEEVNHSVVGISKLQNMGSSVLAEDGIEKLGLGTGVIASANGYIITNRHVSGDKYSTCYVTLENSNTYEATVVWADSDMDLSIVKINMKGLQSIKLGNSDNVQAGQTVYAVGNPLGYEFERTVTAGIISAKSRTIKFNENGEEVLMTDLIQTDATINPGNSGGPLINTNGEVIGINSLKIDSAEGIGFAVPINILKPIIDKYNATGEFKEAIIGISGYDKDIISYIDKSLNLDSGVYIESVTARGPAENSGLRKGDIILKIDGMEIYTINDIKEYIYTKNPGDIIEIEYKRGNNTNVLNLTLG